MSLVAGPPDDADEGLAIASIRIMNGLLLISEMTGVLKPGI